MLSLAAAREATENVAAGQAGGGLEQSPTLPNRPLPVSEPLPPQRLVAIGKPPQRDPLYDLDVEPHPHSVEREVMTEQHALFDAVGEAIERKNYRGARGLLAEHAARFGGDEGWHQHRVGYERALDCVESPGADSRARGAEYVANERLSPLRRRVRRTCLEGRPFSGRG